MGDPESTQQSTTEFPIEDDNQDDLFDRSSYQWMGRSIETLIAGFEHVPPILDPTSSLVFEEEAKDTTTTTTTT